MAARRPQQISFFGTPAFAAQNRLEHGGSVHPGRRKLARPVDPKRPLHVVMRSTRARGHWSFLKTSHERVIRSLVYSTARRFQVKVYRFANSGNHLHLLVSAKTREGYGRYLKTLSGLIARRVTGACKGNPVGKFWDGLAYSRVVQWGREFINVKYYLIRNELEGLGILAWGDRLVRKAGKTGKPTNKASGDPPDSGASE